MIFTLSFRDLHFVIPTGAGAPATAEWRNLLFVCATTARHPEPREPKVGKRKPPTRAKWRSSSSACSSVLKKCLTPPTLLEMAMLQQLRYLAVAY